MYYGNRKIFHIFKFYSQWKGVQGWNFWRLVDAEKALIQNFLTKKV